MANQTKTTFVVTVGTGNSLTETSYATRSKLARALARYVERAHQLPKVTVVKTTILCACEVAGMAEAPYLVKFGTDTLAMTYREYRHLAMSVAVGRAVSPTGVALCVETSDGFTTEASYTKLTMEFMKMVEEMAAQSNDYFVQAANDVADTFLAEFPEFVVVVEDEVVADADASDVPA